VALGRVPCSLFVLLCGCRGVVVGTVGGGRGLMRDVDESSMIGASSDEYNIIITMCINNCGVCTKRRYRRLRVDCSDG